MLQAAKKNFFEDIVSDQDKSLIRIIQYLRYRKVIFPNIFGYALSCLTLNIILLRYVSFQYFVLVASSLFLLFSVRIFQYKKYMKKNLVDDTKIVNQLKITLYYSGLIAFLWLFMSNYLFFVVLNSDHSNLNKLYLFAIIYILSSALLASSSRNMSSFGRASRIFISILSLSIIFLSLQLYFNISEFYGIFALLYSLSHSFICLIGSRKLSNSFILSSMNSIESERNVETIKVLLDDYEQQGVGWLWRTDASQRIESPTAKFVEALKRKINHVEAREFASFFAPGAEAAKLQKNLELGVNFRNLEVPLLIDNKMHFWRLNARAIRSNGQFLGMRGVGVDITDEVRAKGQVEYLSKYDKRTGLINKNTFISQIDKILKKSHRLKEFAIVIISVEYVTELRSLLNIESEDKLLYLISKKFDLFDVPDSHISQISDNRFAVAIRNHSNYGSVSEISKKLTDTFSEVLNFEGKSAQPYVVAGMAIYPTDGVNSAELIGNATLAVNASLKKGRGYCSFFDPAMEAAAIARRRIANGLVTAIGDNQLSVFYQPVVETCSKQIVGYEALMRWSHPEYGNIPPSDFIPVAEETGQIATLGYWLLEETLREVSSWKNDSIISINLSPLQLDEYDFLDRVEQIVSISRVDSSRIEFEVTEGVFIEKSEEKISILNSLIDRGYRVALDDFGTGYSSLGYIQAFSFTKIKIDQCFIHNITSDHTCREIVASIIRLADGIGVITTAEGVESLEQYELLSKLGCTQLQGYYFGRPSPSIETLVLTDPLGAKLPS